MRDRVIVNEQLGEELHAARLDNGLPVYVVPKKGYNKKYATVAVKYGSIDNRFQEAGSAEPIEVPGGIAHFLEHKLFEQEKRNVFSDFAELGASSNAYTNYTSTTYLFSTADNFFECFKILLEFVQNPYFTDENVTKEKGIIEQEIRMYEDMPEVRVSSNLMQALYHVHPVRVDVVGTVDSIRLITKEWLYLCYKMFYRPENMAVLVVGDVEPRRVFDDVDAIAGSAPRGKGEVRRLFPVEPRDVKEASVTQEMSVATPLIELGFKDVAGDARGLGLLKREITTRILLEILFGRSSDLYASLYKDGLINDKFGAAHESELEFAGSFVGGESKDPSGLIDRIMACIEETRNRGISGEVIDRTRRKMLGEFIGLFNSPERFAYQFNSYLFKGIDIFDYAAALKAPAAEAVQARLNEHLIESAHAVSVVKPKSGQ